MDKVLLQAHKGVEFEYPENTMPAFEAAVEQGYNLIELDVSITKDGRFVVLHDKTLNRTARNGDGSSLTEPVEIEQITYSEALEYDFGLYFSEKFAGVMMPLFSDVLAFSKKNGIPLKIDNKIRRFSAENRLGLYDLIIQSGAKVCISCWNRGSALEVIEYLPDADISFDGLYDLVLLSELSSIVGKDRLAVWIPVDREMAEWAPKEWFLLPEECERIKKYAKIALWAVKDTDSFKRACSIYRPWAVETDGRIKP